MIPLRHYIKSLHETVDSGRTLVNLLSLLHSEEARLSPDSLNEFVQDEELTTVLQFCNDSVTDKNLINKIYDKYK